MGLGPGQLPSGLRARGMHISISQSEVMLSSYEIQTFRTLFGRYASAWHRKIPLDPASILVTNGK